MLRMRTEKVDSRATAEMEIYFKAASFFCALLSTFLHEFRMYVCLLVANRAFAVFCNNFLFFACSGASF